MAGAATNTVRSAFVAETTTAVIPTNPAFQTLHGGANLSSEAQTIESRSRSTGGARSGVAYIGSDNEGTLEAPLIYGVYDDWLATLLQGTWASNVLKDGKARSTLTVENAVPAGAGGTLTYLRFRGVEAQGGSLNLAARQEAALSMQLFADGSDDGTTIALTGATYADPGNAVPLTSGADVAGITFDGYTLDCMQSLEVQFAFENRDQQDRIGSDDKCGMSRGDCLPVLNANMYVEANFLAIYNASRGPHDSFSVSIPIGQVTGEKYLIEFPSCRFGSTAIDQSGANVMQRVQILPQYDDTEACVIKVTRAIS